jgi:hypothetical protein
MKKFILLAAMLFGAYTQAQDIAYTTNGGATITDGQEFTFSSLTEAAGKMYIHLKNNSTETFRFKVRVDEIEGNPDSGMAMSIQFCFSTLCYPSFVENNLYPASPVVLEPGASNHPDDHFWNFNPGNGSSPITYTFTVVEVDENGTPIEDLISFTYIYQPTASATDFEALQNIGITLNSTIVKNNLEINANTAATLALFDANGRQVKTAAINEGDQNIELSALSSGVYFADFTTADNKASGIKIVKN